MALLLALAACGGDDPDVELAPEDVVDQAADTIGATPSLRFQINLEGPGVELEDGVLLDRLDGVYAAPDAASTEARVKVLGLTASIDIITIGDRAWQKAPLETDYTELRPGQAPFSAAELFSPSGIPAIMKDDVVDIDRSTGEEPSIEAFPGEKYDVVTGRITGTRISDLTAGLVQADGAIVTIFVTGGEARRIIIDEPGEGRNVWTIDAWAYGDPVSVMPPPGFE